MKPEDLNRAWTHRQILELNFNNRLNFFLLFQSILLAATVNGIGQGNDHIILLAFCIFGGLITLIWWLIQSKEHHMLDTVKNYLRDNDESYCERRKLYTNYLSKISVNQLLSKVIPPMLTLVWMLLIVYLIWT
ncbi:hypothetical protein N6H18_06910 [Reichenbachiella agarivorans]|uniref:Uncharacterized protein n=1 Tax=Reichenbachiella agarivorans TaxID=2979464 RepID=A0ABY6CT39_9BACT|nr:hypothetical protein [Reichenbachiella agarivorans]UXP33682.1 hypothetical protein N6H18_06910 [Reichenbachiella agarivorans]